MNESLYSDRSRDIKITTIFVRQTKRRYSYGFVIIIIEMGHLVHHVYVYDKLWSGDQQEHVN